MHQSDFSTIFRLINRVKHLVARADPRFWRLLFRFPRVGTCFLWKIREKSFSAFWLVDIRTNRTWPSLFFLIPRIKRLVTRADHRILKGALSFPTSNQVFSPKNNREIAYWVWLANISINQNSASFFFGIARVKHLVTQTDHKVLKGALSFSSDH